LLFGTTETFLKRFGIEDVSELPDREGLLEKIRMIEESAPEPTEEELYNFAKQEENPDFLEGEDVELIGADEAASATDEE